MKFGFFYLLILVYFTLTPVFAQDTNQIPVDSIAVPIGTLSQIKDTIYSPIEVEIVPNTNLFVKKKNEIKVKFKPFKIPVNVSHWKNKNMLGFDLSQMAFVNWNAGGTSAVAGLLKGEFIRIRSEINSEWVNELFFRYGLNKQDNVETRKSDDEFRFNSTYSYRKDTLSHWYFGAKFNFKTQFTNGYKYPDTHNPISKPFAPAYTFFGIGANYYIKKKVFDVYLSPLTVKNTLIWNQALADAGAFGTKAATFDENGNKLSLGARTRTELGFLFTNYYKKEVWKNIIMENRLSLYTDYINNFGNVDLDWRLQVEMVVNKYIKTNIGMHMIYDDDVRITEVVNGKNVEIGSKVQLKEALGVGIVYTF